MAKLYFRYGVVSSAKTLNLLAVAHNYRAQNKKILIAKPEMDTRFGSQTVKSRSGLEIAADFLFREKENLEFEACRDLSCILVDEAQFLSVEQIDRLREITIQCKVPVICYGLRTDFSSHLFDGSKRLMEIADTLEEVKTTCYFCNKKGIMNGKWVEGKQVYTGTVIELGGLELYRPVCFEHYYLNI